MYYTFVEFFSLEKVSSFDGKDITNYGISPNKVLRDIAENSAKTGLSYAIGNGSIDAIVIKKRLLDVYASDNFLKMENVVGENIFTIYKEGSACIHPSSNTKAALNNEIRYTPKFWNKDLLAVCNRNENSYILRNGGKKVWTGGKARKISIGLQSIA